MAKKRSPVKFSFESAFITTILSIAAYFSFAEIISEFTG